MEDEFLTNSTTLENKTEETKPQELFTKPIKDGIVEYIEREVDIFDFDGYEVVRREFFSKANCPALTIRYGSIVINLKAIRKLNECRFIQILINQKKKLLIVKPCEEDEKDSLQCSRVNKHGKVVARAISGKIFTAQLFQDMNWNIESTVKILGTLLTCKGEKIFIFDLSNAETYLHLAEPSEDNSKRRKRVPFPPEHWQGNYGLAYEVHKKQIVTTFEGVPEGFVKITIPQLPLRKPPNNENLKPPDYNVMEPPEAILPIDFFTESSVSSNTNILNENVGEVREDGT
jgi:hypothetical protein